MTINWMLIGILFTICLPGVLIAIPRIITYLLPNNSEAIQKRFSSLAIIQTLILVLVLIVAGVILSPQTGLKTVFIDSCLQGDCGADLLIKMLIPTLILSLSGLILFLGIFYYLLPRILEADTIKTMEQMHAALGISGLVLYGGIVEEVMGRWGLMNLSVFFIHLFMPISTGVYWSAIIISAILFAIGQIPAYQAAGCEISRRFIYSFVLLSGLQSLIYGFLFWQYGLESAILAHILFHLGWAAKIESRY